MVAMAVLMVAAAIFYYPWPQTNRLDEIVGQPLFPEYAATQVRNVKIRRVDNLEQTVSELTLKLNADNEWQMVERSNYVASQPQQINAAINFVSDMDVLEFKTDDQQRHQEFGVVDPDEVRTAAALASAGSKITMTDRNGQTLVDVIIGNAEEQASQDQSELPKYFVRIVGQPQVYLVNFNPRVLTTRFGDWVNRDLFRVFARGRGFRGLQVENYLIDVNQLQQDSLNAPRTWLYDFSLQILASNQFRVSSLKLPRPQPSSDETGEDPPAASERQTVELVPELQPAPNMAALQPVLGPFVQAPCIDVLKKPSLSVSTFEKVADEGFTVEAVKDLAPLGFRLSADGDEPRLEGVSGSVRVVNANGVNLHMVIGTLANQSFDSGLAQYAILYATFNPEALPQAPQPLSDEDQQDEEKLRAFRQATQDYERKMQDIRNEVAEYNRQLAPWIYLLDENQVQLMRPALESLVVPATIEGWQDKLGVSAQPEPTPSEPTEAGDNAENSPPADDSDADDGDNESGNGDASESAAGPAEQSNEKESNKDNGDSGDNNGTDND